MKKIDSLFTIMILTAAAVLLVSESARGKTLSFPLQLDYPFLKALVIQSAFTSPGQTMVITDPADHCRRITLSDPGFSGENGLLRVEVAVHLKGGAAVGDRCLFPVEWNGFLTSHVNPRISPGKWQLCFDPVDSILLDVNRRPVTGMERSLWDVFKPFVMSRLENIVIGMNAPIAELKPFLLSVVTEADYPHVIRMVESLRPGLPVAEDNALRIQIFADSKALPREANASVPEALTPEEIDAFIEICETWDAFLIQTLKSLIGQPLTDDERETMLTVLLDTRYRFVSELKAKVPASSGDFVREQFLVAWEKLSPILKKYFVKSMSEQMTGEIPANSWGILAFFTASDALAALDKFGPVFNIEISENGFIRLVRMLSENKSLSLAYGVQADPDLRKLLGMEPLSEIITPVFHEKRPEQKDWGIETESAGPQALMNIQRKILSGIGKILTPGICWAGKNWSHPSLREIRYWLVNKRNVAPHLKKVKILLGAVIAKNFKKNSIPEHYQGIFQRTVYATAWQESCFRQFIVDKNKLTYIRSYNKSSVGMMQINERVWRGIYAIERLRWDISYNAAVGVEILALYLEKYAIPKMKSLKGTNGLDEDGVACSLYAMYNAGPGAFLKYVKRRRSGKPSKIDKHFREKYTWVKSGQWGRLGDCF